MADRYGAIPLDIPAVEDGRQEPCGDPALKVIADFLMAVINARAGAAWRSIATLIGKGTKDAPVNRALWADPVNTAFSETPLPALYVFRSQGGTFEDAAADYRTARSTWTVWWLLRQTTDPKSAVRAPFANAIGKIIDAALDAGRHPAYVQEGDTDTFAPSFEADPDAIATAFASSTDPVELSGADLDGEVGGAEMTPPRSPTITISGPGTDVAVGSTVTWTGLNVLGQEIAVEQEIAGTGIVHAHYDFARVTSVAIGAQTGTGLTMQLGLAARVGLGTHVLSAAGLQEIRATRPTPKTVNMPAGQGNVEPYDALEVILEVEERLVPDLEQYDLLDDGDGADGVNAGANQTFVRRDGSVIDSAFYD
jgi:hypothetical protein